jgi:hypothetical protein
MSLYNTVPPPEPQPNAVVWFFLGSGVACVATMGLPGLIAWLVPGVPPPGPFG